MMTRSDYIRRLRLVGGLIIAVILAAAAVVAVS